MASVLLPKLLFPKPHPSYQPDHENVVWIPDIRRPSRDYRIPCLFLKSNAFSRYFVLFFHGNAEDLGTSHDFCSNLRLCFQVHVVAPELPSYGLANQNVKPAEDTIIDYASSALEFILRDVGWPIDSVIVMGRSIGCFSALELAAQYPSLGGLCLISPFANLRTVVEERVGEFVANYIIDDLAYNNVERIQRVFADTLIIHGRVDRVVQFRNNEWDSTDNYEDADEAFSSEEDEPLHHGVGNNKQELSGPAYLLNYMSTALSPRSSSTTTMQATKYESGSTNRTRTTRTSSTTGGGRERRKKHQGPFPGYAWGNSVASAPASPHHFHHQASAVSSSATTQDRRSQRIARPVPSRSPVSPRLQVRQSGSSPEAPRWKSSSGKIPQENLAPDHIVQRGDNEDAVVAQFLNSFNASLDVGSGSAAHSNVVGPAEGGHGNVMSGIVSSSGEETRHSSSPETPDALVEKNDQPVVVSAKDNILSTLSPAPEAHIHNEQGGPRDDVSVAEKSKNACLKVDNTAKQQLGNGGVSNGGFLAKLGAASGAAKNRFLGRGSFGSANAGWAKKVVAVPGNHVPSGLGTTAQHQLGTPHSTPPFKEILPAVKKTLGPAENWDSVQLSEVDFETTPATGFNFMFLPPSNRAFCREEAKTEELLMRTVDEHGVGIPGHVIDDPRAQKIHPRGSRTDASV